MSESPTAENVARALVAACAETGDDPIRAATGCVGGVHGANIRGRHYAMHALLHVFPTLPRTSAARMVGCPGKPAAFYNNSWNLIARPVSGSLRRANWWDEATYGRVIAAIEKSLVTSTWHGLAIVTRQTSPLLKPEGDLTMRRKPSINVEDVTASLMGDPPPQRSALFNRKPAQSDGEYTP